MSAQLPDRARAVVMGGGIVGVSVAYHLTKRGWKDVVLLERDRLTSGTTWHAAGLLTKLRATYNMSMLAKYAAELVGEVEALTGMGTGYRKVGSMIVARTPGRWEEVKRGISMARVCGFEVHDIPPAEAQRLWPLLDVSDMAGAAWLPEDAVANPTDVTMAIAAAARLGGARIIEHQPVTDLITRDGRVAGVRTDQGDIEAEVVVNCTGMWARFLGARHGVAIPLHAAEHFYLITEPIPGLPPDLPSLRAPDDTTYMREDTGKLMVGFFEPGAKPWATRGIPPESTFTSLPEDWPHITPYLAMAARRVPILRDIGIKTFFNGPESFTPDDRYILGEAPELPGYFVAAGFNSVGFQSGGGAGRALADWIVDGHAPMDLWDVDIRRLFPFQRNRRYLHERTTETLGLLYEMHWPFRSVETARGVRKTPFHDRLAARGAVFGELAGWERAQWFDPGAKPGPPDYSYGRAAWFERTAEEHRAVRDNVGVFDMSGFGKILVSGRDAELALQWICTADVGGDPGRIVYTQWLNERGGIEADLTVVRRSETEFLVIGAAATLRRDVAHLRRTIPPDAHVFVTDVSNAYAGLAVMGPRSRELLSTVTDADLSGEAFPFGASREIELGYGVVRASRITYVGELGWELLIPADMALHVFDTIADAGAAFDLQPYGFRALDSLRLEKAYRHWGHDITDEDTTLEAGLAFTHAWDKQGGFVGREALLRQRDAGVKRRLVSFLLDDPEPLLYHNEPIVRDGVIVGKLTSGWFGHTCGRAIGLGYVRDPEGAAVTPDFLRAGRYELEVANERFPATVHLRAPYDPAGERIRA